VYTTKLFLIFNNGETHTFEKTLGIYFAGVSNFKDPLWHVILSNTIDVNLAISDIP